MKTSLALLSFVLLGATVTVTLGQTSGPRPELVRGHLVERGFSGDLGTTLRGLGEDVWAGYAVPMVAGRHHFCDGGVVSLEGEHRHRGSTSSPSGALFVLLHVERGRVVEIETLSSDCRLDAGQSELVWLTGVAERASLAFLQVLAGGDSRGVAEDAVNAIAFHADLGADAMLGELAGTAPDHDVREKAIFWLGAARGQGGFDWLARRMDVETDIDLKEKIVFAFHVSDVEGSTEKLVELARRDPDRRVREKALFWLSQEAGEIAARAIATSAVEDPDVEVKKKAVFALSQLPPDEGIPLLVEVAETHPNPEVRKKAFFWLGQTGDPRAAALFEKILLAK